MLYRYKGWCRLLLSVCLSLRFLLMEFEEYWSDDIIAKTHRGFSYPCLLQVFPSGSGSGAESFQALKNMSSAYQYVFDTVRQAATVSLTIYCKVYSPVVAKTKPKLRKVSSDPDLSQSPPSNGQEGKKFNTNLFEESPFDAGLAKAKPKLRKVSSDHDLTQSPPSGGREGKKFNTNLFEESPFDAGLAKTKPKLRKVSSDPDLSQSPPSAGREGKKFDTNLLEESPFDAGLDLETLKGTLETLKGMLNAARQGIIDVGETIKGMIDAAGQGTENFNPNLFEASPSDGQAEKKFDPVLFEVSPFDGGQETKNFDPNLFEVSPFDGGQETKNFDPNLFKVLPSDGQAEEAIKGILDAARQGIFDAKETIKGLLDAARQEMKNFDPNLFEVSPSDGQEMKKFEPNLSESSSSDGQEKEFVPDFFEVRSCDGEEMQNSHFRELELSIAKELSDSWFVPVDDRQVSLIVAEKEKMSDGNSSRKKEIMSGANISEEEALLDKYLERLEAEDAATYKEEEMKCNPKLFEVSADGFESLSPLEKRHWIVLQFIRERYDPPVRSETRGPLLEVSDLEDSDQEESVGQQDVALGYGKGEQESEIEDCILDLNSLFLSDD